MNPTPPPKPRRARGTPTQAAGNRFAFTVLGAATVFALLFQYAAGTNYREKAQKNLGFDIFGQSLRPTNLSLPKQSQSNDVTAKSDES